ncbi:unnamed protein product [Closterium sp. NIES-53]
MFLGLHEDSSDYTFYHPPLHRFFDSCDVRFDESVPYYVRCVPRYPSPLGSPSGAASFPAVLLPAYSRPAGAGFRGEDPRGASSRGYGVGEKRAYLCEVLVLGGVRPVLDLEILGRTMLLLVVLALGVVRLVLWRVVLGLPPLRTLLLPPTPTRPGTRPAFAVPVREQLQLEQEERELEWQQLELQRLEEKQQQQHPEQSSRSSSRSSSSSHLLLLSLVFGPSVSPLLLLPPPPSPPVFGPPLTPPDPSPAVFPPPLPPLSPPLSHTWPSRRSPRACPSSPVPFTDLRTALFCSSPPYLSPSVLSSPSESALIASLSTPYTDYYRMYRPVLSCVLASLVTEPRASLSSVSALTSSVTEFASTRCLDYATSLVAAPPTSPLTIGGEFALSCDALEDTQFELDFLAAASPHLCAMLFAPEGDPDALDIPTPHTYAEAVSWPWASQWRAAMDSKMASYRSTGTYVDEVPPPWGERSRWHVDLQGEAATEISSCLQGALCGQRFQSARGITLSLTGTFPPGTKWRLRRPVYGLRQAPREWYDTLRSTLSYLGFQPSSADPSLFVRRGSTPFFVLVYVDDLVFAAADRVALADMKLELQKRHTCIDLDQLRHYLGLQITRDRAARTITLSQSHMVQQVLQRFELQHSTVQRTPLAVDHRLTGPYSDEPFEPSSPYAELFGSLMYLMTLCGDVVIHPEICFFVTGL